MKKTYDKRIIINRALPSWFDDAKLGIFIHWGLFSVPAYAYIEEGQDINVLMANKGIDYNLTHNPYAEWYLNSLRIDGSPTQAYHEEHYDSKAYEDFATDFNESIQQWKPEAWADLFQQAGARYAVLVTKHHDGFTLWSSDYPNPRRPGYHAIRDVPGELSAAVRSRGLRFGTYYSGKLDWTFTHGPIHDAASMLANGSNTQEYIDYANHHWHELIDKYQPDILWNDIGYPAGTDVNEIFAYFYGKHPDGVINNRFIQLPKAAASLEKHKFIARIVNGIANMVVKQGMDPRPKVHHDFETPEYKVYNEIREKKWESNRGIGLSFGYNQFETEKEYISLEGLIHMFIDIVSKNGNLLLNVGPMADGTIPEIQAQRLFGLGHWLQINGEAIFETRPWIKPSTVTTDNLQVRFTKTAGVLYAIVLTSTEQSSTMNDLAIMNLSLPSDARITLLGMEGNLDWKMDGSNAVISFNDSPAAPALAFKIDGVP
ncbi:MAG TPA: alpha-L-fucosidase [Candidatus Lokiarchaeia archaeon]|nr:alpha-L-fucosidase [Candidatus Lokiarchaeia archaeon]